MNSRRQRSEWRPSGAGASTDHRPTAFAQAAADLLELSGGDSRGSWREAQDQVGITAANAAGDASGKAARWRATQLLGENEIGRALAVLEAAVAADPREDLRALVATAHLYRGDFVAAEPFAEGESTDARALRGILQAQQLAPGALEAVTSLARNARERREHPIDAELASQLAFMRGQLDDVATSGDEAVIAGSELGRGWRKGERAVISAASLLARGRLDEFAEAIAVGFAVCDDAGNHWATRRLLLLQLHLADLRSDRAMVDELRTQIEVLSVRIPPLFRDGPLYGFGERLAHAERVAGEPSGPTAKSTADAIRRALSSGFVIGIVCPLLVGRVMGLMALRMRQRKGVREIFEAAIRQGVDRGWQIETAIARVQFSEVADELGARRLDTSDDEQYLRSLGIESATFALRAARALVLSREKSLVTQREAEVLALLSEGLSIRQVAERLQIGEGTVNTHIRHAKQKMGIAGMTGARATALIAETQRKRG